MQKCFRVCDVLISFHVEVTFVISCQLIWWIRHLLSLWLL